MGYYSVKNRIGSHEQVSESMGTIHGIGLIATGIKLNSNGDSVELVMSNKKNSNNGKIDVYSSSVYFRTKNGNVFCITNGFVMDSKNNSKKLDMHQSKHLTVGRPFSFTGSSSRVSEIYIFDRYIHTSQTAPSKGIIAEFKRGRNSRLLRN